MIADPIVLMVLDFLHRPAHVSAALLLLAPACSYETKVPAPAAGVQPLPIESSPTPAVVSMSGPAGSAPVPDSTAATDQTRRSGPTAPTDQTGALSSTGADEYTKDLDRICHVHEITGKSADLGLQAVSQWLLENIRTVEARRRLAELPQADVPIWLQNLRRDAAARGISPCPFSDTWEAVLKSPRR